jgi:hypothetical protein
MYCFVDKSVGGFESKEAGILTPSHCVEVETILRWIPFWLNWLFCLYRFGYICTAGCVRFFVGSIVLDSLGRRYLHIEVHGIVKTTLRTGR